MNDTAAAPLDPVARLHVLAAALPGSVVAERTIEASLDRVWPVVTDLETMTPRYERNVRAIEIVDRNGEWAHIIATLSSGGTEAMDVRMVPGWCLMQSKSTVVAFAARPVGDHTVLAHLEHDRRRSDARAVPASDAARAELEYELDVIASLAMEA